MEASGSPWGSGPRRCWRPAATDPRSRSRSGKAPYALARPDQPVTLAIKDSNPPIADGLSPESGGDFKILNYSDYMAPGVMKDFGKKHGVSVQVTPYNNYDEMLAKIRAPGESFDLVFPGPSVLSKMVYTELLQPLNHTLRPQPRQRLAGVPGPVVRPRGSLHRALHDLRHRRALPHRPGERGAGERLRPHVGQAVRRQGLHPRRPGRGHRDVAAAQQHHDRHQHEQRRLRLRRRPTR